jgi:hypothetical protein
MDNIKWYWWLLIGMVVMFVVLKMFSQAVDKSSDTWLYTKRLLASNQFNNLTKTNEFREIVKMPEFTSLLKTLAEDQIISTSKALFQ